MSTAPVLEREYTHTNGQPIPLLPGFITRLQNRFNRGFELERCFDYPNVLAFRYRGPNDVGRMVYHYVAQHPIWDNPYADCKPRNPKVGYAFASFSGAWPLMECIVTAGGTLGECWSDDEVRSEVLYLGLRYTLNLLTGKAYARGELPQAYNTKGYKVRPWCYPCDTDPLDCLCVAAAA